jgi:hypothetical protein
MKKNLRVFLAAGLIGLFSTSCDKVTQDLDLIVNADVIRYSVLVQVTEPSGALPTNLSISVTGEDAAAIYDIAGNKNLIISNGIISLGVHPRNEPTETDPIRFNVKLSGPNHLATTIPVTIKKDQFNQIKSGTVLKLSAAPATVSIANKTVTLAPNGTSAEPITISNPVTASTPVETKVTVPANTQFLSAAGTPLTGGALTMTTINYNTQSATMATLFPGGNLNATDVTGPNGSKISAFFMPAGFTSINMKVGNTEVKKFSTPISISMELNAAFKLQGSATSIKAGDKIGIWSYSEDTGKWTYEKEGTIAEVNGKPAVSFTTDHLTVYSAAEHVVTTNCVSPTLVYDAAWLNSDTEPVTVEAWNDELTTRYYAKTVIMKHNLEDELTDLPTFATRYKVLNGRSEIIASGRLDNPCTGGRPKVVLPAPAANVVGITLTLNVKCPSTDKRNEISVTPPDFYLYYKPAGAPQSAYKLLGLVEKGKLRTTLLDVGSTYNFKTQWNGYIKETSPQQITSKDMSTTVGENDFLGTRTPDQNKAILIEECSKL